MIMQKDPAADRPVVKPIHAADNDLSRKAEYVSRAPFSLGRL